MNGSGVAAGGLVRVELDENGRLADLFLDPQVAHLPVEELRAALISAFTSASTSASSSASASALELAEHRFAEISTALYDLSRRAGRQW